MIEILGKWGNCNNLDCKFIKLEFLWFLWRGFSNFSLTREERPLSLDQGGFKSGQVWVNIFIL